MSFGLPEWLTGVYKVKGKHGFGTAFAPPKDWGELDRLLDYFFQNNPDYITRYFEVYNEPLAHWQGTEKELIRFHQAVAKAIKKVKPQTKVLGPCLYSIRMNDLRSLAAKGLFNNLDGIVMHAYVYGTPPEADFFERLKALNAFRNQPKYAKMPIFLTEFGWTSAEGTWQIPVDELTQGQYCARSLALSVSQNINQLVYFCLDYKTKAVGEASFSLIDATGRPKIGLSAFAAIAKNFGGAKFVDDIKISPSGYMIVTKRKNDYAIALWDSENTKKIKLPFEIDSAIDMVGSVLDIPAEQSFTISRSPIYLFTKNYNIVAKKGRKIIKRIQGQRLPWQANKIFICEQGWKNQGVINIPPSVTTGKYTIFVKKGKMWSKQTINIERPLDIQSAEINWPLANVYPAVLVTLASNISDKPLAVKVSLGTTKKTNLTLPPGTLRQINFNLSDFIFAKRFKTDILMECRDGGKFWQIKDKLDITIVPAYKLKGSEIKKKSWLDITNWAPYKNIYNENPENPDCKVMLQCRYNEEFIEFAVKVYDDEHVQKMAEKNPGRMWAQDSVQIAFDLDREKKWVAGVGGGSLLGGHRIFGFCTGKKINSNAGITFRHRSYNDTLPKNMVEPKIISTITRKGNITLYRIRFPWLVLAAEDPPAAGGKIGFALVVNDVDPKHKRKRHGVRIFKGIAASKDPKLFGELWLR